MRFNRAPIVEASDYCICPQCKTDRYIQVKGVKISWVVCGRCELLGPIGKNRAEAIDKWNQMVWDMTEPDKERTVWM